MKRNVLVSMVSFVLLATGAAAGGAERTPRWEAANPIIPLPKPPLGIDSTFEELKDPPTPERVRLGR